MLVSTQSIQEVVDHLKSGALAAIPTETVYGLVADAKNISAIEKIFALKKRPKSQPLSVLIADKMQMKDWAINIPDFAWALAGAFWPGPLTLVLPKAAHVSDVLTARQNTVGLRVPAHPLALEILSLFQGGLAAPSANPSGKPSATTANQVATYFSEDLWIVDGGECTIGTASTIVDCSGTDPVILRQGKITREDIQKVLE